MRNTLTLTVLVATSLLPFVQVEIPASGPVTVLSLVRAETDMTLKRYVDQGGFGQFIHLRESIAEPQKLIDPNFTDH